MLGILSSFGGKMIFKKKQKGFSLLEVVVAFSILLIIIVPVFNMIGVLIKKENNITKGTSQIFVDSSSTSFDFLLKNFFYNVKK